jgi:hypothetical protein
MTEDDIRKYCEDALRDVKPFVNEINDGALTYMFNHAKRCYDENVREDDEGWITNYYTTYGMFIAISTYINEYNKMHNKPERVFV